MKFAKELEQDLVPEWRIKYLNYKAGKKYVKGVARAIHRANATPKTPGRKHDQLPPREPLSSLLSPSPRHQGSGGLDRHRIDAAKPLTSSPPLLEQSQRLQPTNASALNESQSLTGPSGNSPNYGSFAPTSPPKPGLTKLDSRQTFKLPDPAIYLPSSSLDDKPGVSGHSSSGAIPEPRLTHHRSKSFGPTVKEPSHAATLPPSGSRPSPASGRLRRLFSQDLHLDNTRAAEDGYPLQALDTVRQREKEFLDFLDSELDKVETFYRQKEVHAEERLNVLREQLHEMRNRRAQDLAERRQRKDQRASADLMGYSAGFDGLPKWIDPIKAKFFKPGENSKALERMPQTPMVGAMSGDARRDYIRKPLEHDVPYRIAKRKLKVALQEFYRGLELLKAYALMNRTAFRKLNKKYDKAVNARPPYRYMNEKVNKSWFVNSEVIDEHIRAVEDLYARYFEGGNHKIAAGKLRRINRQPADESRISFWNGLAIGIGAVFSIEGVTYGAELLFDPDPTVRLQTSYLLQIYGGYFFMLLLFSLFCLDCYVWTANKINYPFIFEFDPRNHLDWRQLASFPSFFFLLFGLFLWLNFTRYGDDRLWLYYPVILIFISLLIIFFPARTLFHRSRQWFAYSHFRLFFAGLYPVEFRDFFLGDMYCSLTYATSNVELFFCLYANYWEDPVICNSSHSRLLGFFSALPAIWRALQCIRRYHDTKNVFPHLVNCGKYAATILSYVTLSLYRLNNTPTHQALFITFSIINGLYTSIWDLFMDFSLLQPESRHPYLRDILGLRRRSLYYTIMVVDPILRFGWIFYAIFTHDLQHSAVTSVFVALLEVIRRGMWSLLRVENEHCGNVAQYKASRDVPLPYDLVHETILDRTSTDEAPARSDTRLSATEMSQVPSQGQGRSDAQPSTYSPASVAEAGLRRRRKSEAAGAKSIRGIMATAHRQDFEKRRPATDAKKKSGSGSTDDLRSDDDDDDDDAESMDEERLEIRRVVTLVREEGNDEHS
ncbi:EXS family-domain-containing protein [Astrocystis sublimbata]|nr:EXS family-domain-containing protein [Astrocystis sublimbata]